jgi:NAD(P)-dependent dehydrogenase (short-subunit alcohol dehydrogenase family)
VSLAKHVPIDLTSDESIRDSLNALAGFEFNVLIAIRTLEGRSKEALLIDNSENKLNWLDSLFAVCRDRYESIKSNNIPVIALCLSAYRDDHLDPFTGLASGFMKSLSRELNGPPCRIINTDENNFYRALRQVEIELGQESDEQVEVCYREGVRSTFAAAPVESLAQQDQQPVLDSESVVIATGGARGVTAVLVEELLRNVGCRVIALGRTDPTAAPENARSMDEQAFKDYEPQFYRDELARNKGRKITDLKRDYLGFRAVNEVCRITKELQAISERFEYQCVDITDEAAIDKVVEAAYRKYGRVDLVLHGAGVQVSKALTKKSVSDFRRIIDTKLGGLRHLYKACEKYRQNYPGPHPIHFHLLTSAFSYMGNDGQPDYGAANEAMNRIAACMNSPQTGTHWSSMAWLGWAGIGMTRDSEFAALAAARRLRGVTKEEGQQIFSEMIKGRPTTPINILLADGEIDYYKVAIQTTPVKAVATASSASTRQDFYTTEREISIANAPYLVNHLVDGVPTFPGAFVISIFAEAALELRPNLKIISFEKASFRRFVKVYENRKARIRVEAQIVSETDQEALLRVRILSDFVHSSGLVLQKDVLQHEILVRMSPSLPTAPRYFELNGNGGLRSPDPYTMDGSPVSLSGPFNAIKNLTIGEEERTAGFEFPGFEHSNGNSQSALSRIVLMDSLWRFGVIQAPRDNVLTVFVPEACEVMRVYFDFAEFDVSQLIGPVTFSGTNPRPDGERLHMGPVVAIDENGNTLVMVERGVCRRFGEVRNAHAAFSRAV